MQRATSPVERKDLPEFLAQGLSLAVVTRDDRMMVETQRCAGARMDAEGRVWLAIPLPDGRRTLANVEATGAIALVAAYPLTYRTVQLKGSDAARVEWPELAEVAAVHRQRLMDVLAHFGTSHAVLRFWSNDFAAVRFTPTEMYDQTPGPGAGLPLMV